MTGPNYYWRLLVTGCCFLGFSVGGAILSVLVFPALYLCTRDRDRRNQQAKWLIHKSFALMVAVLRTSGTFRFEIVGAERLRDAGDALVIANHPSIIDIVVLLSIMPGANCIVKSALWGNPFIRGVVRAAGYISNSSPEGLVDDCIRALHAGGPLVIFPEGTRSQPDRMLPFLRGTAHIALGSGKPIIPVLLRCEPPTLVRGSRWYMIPPTTPRFRVVVMPPLRAAELADTARPPAIAARGLTVALERYFTRELASL